MNIVAVNTLNHSLENLKQHAVFAMQTLKYP